VLLVKAGGTPADGRVNANPDQTGGIVMGVRSSSTAAVLDPEPSELLDRVGIPVEIDHYIVPGTGGHGRARADALLAVAGTFGCRVAVYGYNATRNDTFLVMVGARPALDTLELLLPEVAIQMEQAARAAVKAYGSQVTSALPQMNATTQRRVLTRPYFRDFIRGYGFSIAEQIRTLRASYIETAGPGLVQVLQASQARIEEMFRRDFPDRQSLRKERGEHRRGLVTGRTAGQQAGFGDHYLAVHDLVFAAL
jgi:hypothetical protein